jgi:hypothetical protein
MRDLSWSSHRPSINHRDSGDMSSWVKTLVVLALVVPMTAYVAGSLVASSSYEPSDRRPVIIQDAPSQESDRTAPVTGTPPSARPAPTRSPTGPGTGRGTGQPPPSGTVEDDDATVVLPPPTSVDDDDDDDDDGPEESDDDEGDDDGDDD